MSYVATFMIILGCLIIAGALFAIVLELIRNTRSREDSIDTFVDSFNAGQFEDRDGRGGR